MYVRELTEREYASLKAQMSEVGCMLLSPKAPHVAVEAGDGVVVTESAPQSASNSGARDAAVDAAEARAKQVISDLDSGLVSRRNSVAVKQAAKRSIRNADLARSIGRLG